MILCSRLKVHVKLTLSDKCGLRLFAGGLHLCKANEKVSVPTFDSFFGEIDGTDHHADAGPTVPQMHLPHLTAQSCKLLVFLPS